MVFLPTNMGMIQLNIVDILKIACHRASEREHGHSGLV